MTETLSLHRPTNAVRFVTAASLFDGHDAAINIMRRILQSQGAEVIHLGHNRSVDEVVRAAVDEDVQGVAVSSYQGGHVEFFTYLVQRLNEERRGHVKVYGGGGGVIVPAEIEALHNVGIRRIFSPEDGQRLGLAPMVNTMIADCDADLAHEPPSLPGVLGGNRADLARAITCVETEALDPTTMAELRSAAATRDIPVLGVTGTGGSGKSSLTDELVLRLRLDHEDKVRIAVLAVDPTRRRSGGALLGDRIRMNAIDTPTCFFRSLATRGAGEIPAHLGDVIIVCKAAGYDVVIVETPGIGQGGAGIVPLVDRSLYVMTPDYGAPSQLEKIDMLDFADAVAINKFDRRGGDDALHDVRRQVIRNREAFGVAPEELPVFGTIAARFNDDGVTALYQHLARELATIGLRVGGRLPTVGTKASTVRTAIVPSERGRYLADAADCVRRYHAHTRNQAAVARHRQHLVAARDALEAAGDDVTTISKLVADVDRAIDGQSRTLLDGWSGTAASYDGDEQVVDVRGRAIRTPLTRRSLSGTVVPRLALPRFSDDGDLLQWLRGENLPGHFPFTAGVFAFKRDDELPTRMFAGEGGPGRTNDRFHLLATGQPATRLSTAFDSVTLYGFDPDERPDIYGKVGNSGVSIATLDDMKTLFDGFDLCDPTTSVSMTINGPAPAILAMFFNTAIDQHPELDAAEVLRRVRGTVQADILKEDQGQNTCIFSTEFALRMMGDIQEWFVAHQVRNFYSVSISGYHIAEAGANPITQLAFTLANGLTYVEAYLARDMSVDDFAPNLSFFLSNGMDPEYTVLGRVARRVWAIVMRERYGANERSQKLKYHIQTSGRSLHAQEMAFNDIRTTLQALCAVYDNANSLHTNAYDEAVTTPTEDSVRRALAIQLIIASEWGLAFNENPLQGSFIVDELTDLVEAAVLAELDRLSERGGVLGAMELGYQRGRIQDESMLYEQRKHDGTLPIVGVNAFRAPASRGDAQGPPQLARSSDEEKFDQLERLRRFQTAHVDERARALESLRSAALAGANTFDVLMETVRSCSLGEITDALFDVGGRYRRNL
jgi:methylmalonyl-CoA mutase